MMPSFILPPGGVMSPDQVTRRRKMADAMMQQAGDTSPVGHWTQGAARMANALAGGINNWRADKGEAAGQQSYQDMMAQHLSSDGNPSQEGMTDQQYFEGVSHPWSTPAGNAMLGKMYDRYNPEPLEPTPEQRDYDRGLKDPAFADYERKMKEAGRPITTIDTVGESAEAKKAGELRGDAMYKLESGESIKGYQQIELAARMLEGIDTSALGDVQMKVGGIFAALGLPVKALETLGIDPEMITTGPAVQSLVNRSVVAMIGSGQFPAQNFSDTDRIFLEKIFPSLTNLPEANKLIGGVASRLMQIENEKRQAWMQARSEGMEFRDFNFMWNDQLMQRDIFGDIAKEAQRMAGAETPLPQGAGAPGKGNLGIRTWNPATGKIE